MSLPDGFRTNKNKIRSSVCSFYKFGSSISPFQKLGKTRRCNKNFLKHGSKLYSKKVCYTSVCRVNIFFTPNFFPIGIELNRFYLKITHAKNPKTTKVGN